eukprot:scaffold18618_cov21-Tisochrysis_lutea.AAC.2
MLGAHAGSAGCYKDGGGGPGSFGAHAAPPEPQHYHHCSWGSWQHQRWQAGQREQRRQEQGQQQQQCGLGTGRHMRQLQHRRPSCNLAAAVWPECRWGTRACCSVACASCSVTVTGPWVQVGACASCSVGNDSMAWVEMGHMCKLQCGSDSVAWLQVWDYAVRELGIASHIRLALDDRSPGWMIWNGDVLEKK